MKTKIILSLVLGLVLGLSLSLKSQSLTDSIHIQRYFGSNYIQNDQRLSFGELEELMIVDEQAYTLFRSAKLIKNFSALIGVSGFLMAAIPMTSQFTGKQINWNLVLTGAAFIGLSIPLNLGGTRNIHKAIDIFNKGVNDSSRERSRLSLNINNAGFGLAWNF